MAKAKKVETKAARAKRAGYKGIKKTVAAAYKAWEVRRKLYGKNGLSASA